MVVEESAGRLGKTLLRAAGLQAKSVNAARWQQQIMV
jgi:hypothetical protein